ncbi:MAG: YggU family protein [Proteobacteria bacterium]|nr:YggU family protein [Pseudomonadota bacterium]
MLAIQENTRGITFKVFVQPRSSKNSIAGVHGDALKIKLKAPPVDDAANKMCIQFLAKCLNVPKSSLEIISGHHSRTKRLLLRFSDPKNASQTALEQLKRLIPALIDSSKTA